MYGRNEDMLFRRKKKNIDRIRKMPAEELAKVFNRITDYCPAYQDGKVFCAKTDCHACIVEWLESEAK